MKYEVEIAGQMLALEFEPSDDLITAQIDGQSYQVTVLKPEANLYTLLVNDRVYEFSVSPDQQSELLQLQLGSERFAARVIDRKQRQHKGEAHLAGAQTINAPMPGRVVQILKAVGEPVQAGEGVIVIEAMKMQNQLSATKSGNVTEIKVTIGQTVTAGAVLAVVE